MVSGVSFKNPQAARKSQAKKKIVSTGILLMFVMLVVVLGIYGVGVFLKNRAESAREVLRVEIADKEARISERTAEVARFANSLIVLDQHLYTDHGAETILQELERTIVPRVVLLSVEYAKDLRAGDGVYKLSVTGDVETFDALAAQIAAWKESSLFQNVRAGGTTRDEETGRLIFSIDMNLAPAAEGNRPFDFIKVEDAAAEVETQDENETSIDTEGGENEVIIDAEDERVTQGEVEENQVQQEDGLDADQEPIQ